MVKKKGLATVVLLLLVLLSFFLLIISMYQTSVTYNSSRRPTEVKRQIQRRMSQAAHILCDRSNRNYDICSTNGPTILNPRESSLWILGPNESPPFVQRVQPYPRKFDKITMGFIGEIILISSPTNPSCTVNHSSPALVFTVSKQHTPNFFHDFIDAFIPLFITTNTLFPDQDFTLVILQAHDWWINKYTDLLHVFSNHPIINFGNENVTHCFPSATVGLMSHGSMKIDSKLLPNSKSIRDFRALLQKAYGKNYFNPSIVRAPNARPRLVLASRSGSIGRVILNQNEVKQAAEAAGFEVIIFEPTFNTSLQESHALIHSCHVMVGVHGAALTHLLFLRPGAVFIQIVPIGVEREAEICFGNSARKLRLEYMEYNIDLEESSLLAKYGKDSLLVKDPVALMEKIWLGGTNGSKTSDQVTLDFGKFMEYQKTLDIYLKEQNVKLNVDKFSAYLKEVYTKAKSFRDNVG